jgi:uncharacterized protein
MNAKINNKNVIITGASGGIGEKMALRVAENGGNLALIARSAERLEALKEKISRQFQVKVETYRLDVSEFEKVPKVFSSILEEFQSIDVLINNAGYGVFDEAHEARFEDIKGMFDVNVLGLVACTQQVLPHMRERRSGHIVNIASQAGKLATPKSSAYAASKHAVLGFTNSLRMEASQSGVYVTSVNPGPIATNFFSIADKSGSYVKNVEKFMLNPERVAVKVIDALFTRKREVNLPRWMNFGSAIYQLAPRVVERLGKNAFYKK